MSIECQEGCGPGDPIVIETPDGRELEVLVPEGVSAGEAFEVDVGPDMGDDPGAASEDALDDELAMRMGAEDSYDDDDTLNDM